MNFWLEPMNIYCERTSAAFWSEPVNALTNFVFILVGIHILYLLKKNNIVSKYLRFLAVNTIAIGVGSFLFHTYANFLTMWMDVLPITFLICLTFFYVSKFIFKLSWTLSVTFVVAFFILGIALNFINPPILNGSLVYTHALAGLILISYFSRKNQPQISYYFTIASGIFFVSLCFRSIDIANCLVLPLGTHFLWHCLNGVTIWLTQKGMVEFARITR